jgi:hypothetical protein
LPLSNGGDDRYMTVLGKGWEAAKPTTCSSYIAMGRTLLPALSLQLGDITVVETRIESTENAVPSGNFIAVCITVEALMWCLLCDNIVTAIALAPLFRVSGVMSKYCDK